MKNVETREATKHCRRIFALFWQVSISMCIRAVEIHSCYTIGRIIVLRVNSSDKLLGGILISNRQSTLREGIGNRARGVKRVKNEM